MMSFGEFFLIWLAAFFAYALIIEPAEIYFRKWRDKRREVSH